MTTALIPLRDFAILTAENVQHALQRGNAIIAAGDFDKERELARICNRTRVTDVLHGFHIDGRIIGEKISNLIDDELPYRVMYDTMLVFNIRYAIMELQGTKHLPELIEDTKNKLARFEEEALYVHFAKILDSLTDYIFSTCAKYKVDFVTHYQTTLYTLVKL